MNLLGLFLDQIIDLQSDKMIPWKIAIPYRKKYPVGFISLSYIFPFESSVNI